MKILVADANTDYAHRYQHHVEGVGHKAVAVKGYLEIFNYLLREESFDVALINMDLLHEPVLQVNNGNLKICCPEIFGKMKGSGLAALVRKFKEFNPKLVAVGYNIEPVFKRKKSSEMTEGMDLYLENSDIYNYLSGLKSHNN